MKSYLLAAAVAVMGLGSMANAVVIADFAADFKGWGMPEGWTYGYCPWNNHANVQPLEWRQISVEPVIYAYATEAGFGGPYIAHAGFLQLGGGEWLALRYTVDQDYTNASITGSFTTVNDSWDGMTLVVRFNANPWQLDRYFTSDGGMGVTTNVNMTGLTLNKGDVINFLWDGRGNNNADQISLDLVIAGDVVPEPASLSMLGLASLALLARRK